jgi:hypothetical protein
MDTAREEQSAAQAVARTLRKQRPARAARMPRFSLEFLVRQCEELACHDPDGEERYFGGGEES